MRLFFVRHGQTIWNVLRLVQGSSDIALTEEGIDQAQEFATKNQAFMNLDFDAAYSSDLQRALKTAEILCESKSDLSFSMAIELRERFLGKFEGMELDHMIASLKDWESLPEPEKWTTDAADGETFACLVDRIMAFIEKLQNTHSDNETILLITHSDVMRALYLHLTGGLSIAKMVGFHNLGYMVVEIEEGVLTVAEAEGQVVLP